MFCEKCGTEITNGSMFCHNCGTKINTDAQAAQEEPIKYNMGSTANNNTSAPKAASPSPFGIASLVTGIVGLFFLGIVFGILAIIFASIAKKNNGGVRDGLSTAGLVMGIISLVVWLITIIVAAAFIGSAFSMFGAGMMDLY